MFDHIKQKAKRDHFFIWKKGYSARQFILINFPGKTMAIALVGKGTDTEGLSSSTESGAVDKLSHVQRRNL